MSDAAENPTSPYRVLARKYRPQDFGDLIGQEPMVTTLTNAFRTGRIAQAYMLTGVRGIGKTTTARILARALNYKFGDVDQPSIDMVQEGEHCRAIMEGRHIDVIEMDAASHTGIDDIRDIIESGQYAPAIARYKVYIIDEVHMLSRNAFNGLLKTLEEPPAHLKFIFATTEIRKVPVTVLSRCQRFDLRRIDSGLLAEHLQKISTAETVAAEEDALALIARAAEGSVRDALSILDQAIAHGSDRVEASSVRAMLGLADRARVIDLFEYVMKGDVKAALDELKDQYDIGADPSVVLTDLADFLHYVTRLKYVPDAASNHSLSQVERERGGDFAKRLSVRILGRAWQILVKGIAEVQASERPLAAADMVLVRLAHAADLPAPDELIRDMQSGDGASRLLSSPVKQAGSSVSADPSSPSSGGAARMISAASGETGPRAASQQVAEPVVAAVTPPQLRLNGFEELILLAEDKRDIKLRTLLRKNVRVVSFSDGRIEFNLTGNPPPDFVSELGAKLQAWTGKRWTIAVSREGGAPSLEESEAAEVESRTEAARSDPAVEAILSQFPGARIIDVRVREPEDPSQGDLPEDPDDLDDSIS